MKGDVALEDVGVLRVVGLGSVRLRNADDLAELGDEKGVVRTLRPAGLFPMGDERSDV